MKLTIRKLALLFIPILGMVTGAFLINPGPPLSVSEAAGSHFYAQAKKNGTYYGVWATIETADPKIREVYFSYASVNIINGTKWVETGWVKSSTSGCVPKFSWAIQPGTANIIDSPRPSVGVAYQYQITRNSPGSWKIRIMNTGGLVLWQTDVTNTGLNSGAEIQAVGEVDSANKKNDMGVSGLLSLKWRDSASIWYNWNGWALGVVNNPPYSVVGVTGDPNNNVQVRGNQGTSVPPGAPCP